jgi:hypothetical protein
MGSLVRLWPAVLFFLSVGAWAQALAEPLQADQPMWADPELTLAGRQAP